MERDPTRTRAIFPKCTGSRTNAGGENVNWMTVTQWLVSIGRCTLTEDGVTFWWPCSEIDSRSARWPIYIPSLRCRAVSRASLSLPLLLAQWQSARLLVQVKVQQAAVSVKVRVTVSDWETASALALLPSFCSSLTRADLLCLCAFNELHSNWPPQETLAVSKLCPCRPPFGLLPDAQRRPSLFAVFSRSHSLFLQF